MKALDLVTARPVSLLVIEHASYSLPWLERGAHGQPSAPGGQLSSDVIVISQLASEPPSGFATRVLRKVAKLAPAATVMSAVLSCGPRSDEASLSARAAIAHALFSLTRRSPESALTLAAAPAASDRLRHQLMAIAGTLLEQAPSPGASVSVQLGDRSASHALPKRGSVVSKKVA